MRISTLVLTLVAAVNTQPQPLSSTNTSISSNQAAVIKDYFNLITREPMLSTQKIQQSKHFVKPYISNVSVFTDSMRKLDYVTWIDPTIEKCYEDLHQSIMQISQLLKPASTRQVRNIIGSAIASLTGLVTTEELTNAMQQIDTQDSQDETLIQLTRLTTNQNHIKDTLAQFEQALKHQQEGATRALLVMKHYAFALNLLQLTTHYKNRWMEISQSIMSGMPTLHTVSQRAIDEATAHCRAHYGTDDHDTTLGITDQHRNTQIFPSLQSSKAFYFTHIQEQEMSLITQIMMPIYQHGFTLAPVTNKHGSTNWLLLNRQKTGGALINEHQRTSFATHYRTTFVNDRLIFLNTKEVLCLINHGHEESCDIQMHRVDDNHFLFTGNQHPATVTCGSKRSNINLSSFQLLFLPFSCRLATPSYTIHEHTNAPFSRHLETIRTLRTTSNDLMEVREPENNQHDRSLGLYTLQFNSKTDPLEKDDFQGPITMLYQRLQRRLEQRRKHRHEIQSTTMRIIWPTYLVGGVILAAAVLIMLLLIYIIKYSQ